MESKGQERVSEWIVGIRPAAEHYLARGRDRGLGAPANARPAGLMG